MFALLASADQEILAIIAEPFLERVGQGREQLIRYSAVQDFNGLKMTAHSLKGVIGHFALSDLEARLGQIENNARIEQLNTGQLDEVLSLLDALEGALREYVSR